MPYLTLKTVMSLSDGGVDGTPLAAIARSRVVFSFQDAVSDALVAAVLLIFPSRTDCPFISHFPKVPSPDSECSRLCSACGYGCRTRTRRCNIVRPTINTTTTITKRRTLPIARDMSNSLVLDESQRRMPPTSLLGVMYKGITVTPHSRQRLSKDCE